MQGRWVPLKYRLIKFIVFFFGLNFIIMTKRHNAGSLLWDVGGTSLTIIERPSGAHKFSENLVEATAGAQTYKILTFVSVISELIPSL